MESGLGSNRLYDSAHIRNARRFMEQAWGHRSFEALLWAVENLIQDAEINKPSSDRSRVRRVKGK